MNRHTTFLSILFLLIGLASFANAQDAAVPATSKLREANKLIEEIYGQQLKAAQTGTLKSELAATLQRDATASKKNPAQYYAMLNTAIELAAEASDTGLAMGLVEDLDEVFEIDRQEMSIDALSDCVSKARGADRDRVALDLANLLDIAMQSDDVEYMKELASLGYKMASRAKNRELGQQFKDAKKKIAKLVNQNKEYESAVATLAKNPDDVGANQIMGQHYCFAKSDWSKGLECFAKVDGSDVQSIAEAELKNPSDAQDQLELARMWATYADEAKEYQNPIRLRARHWYLQSVSQLKGIKKRQAQAELDKLEISSENLRPRKMEKYVISSGDDNTIRVWDVKTGVAKSIISEVPMDTRAISMCPEGKFFASGSRDNYARIWNLETGKLQFKLTLQSSDVGAVAYSPDGNWLASGNAYGELYIWNAKTGKEKSHIKLDSKYVWGLDWKPDGSQIAAALGDGSVFLVDATTGKTQQINAHTGTVRSVCYSPNGKRLLSGGKDKTVKMWNPTTAATDGTLTAHDRAVTSIDFSPSGKLIVTASDDYKVRVWTQAGKPLHDLMGHKSHVVTVRFSPSGRIIASCGWDDLVILWDAKTGKRLNTFDKHTGNVWGLDFGF